MRAQGVCGLNHACRHQTVISADDYADEIEVPLLMMTMNS
jgi:hypothetical protein